MADEKRALQEISQAKRSRRTVESFQTEEEAIQREKAAADELRKQLDDPETKALHERADAIKAELDQIKKEGDEAYNNRSKLFDERNELKAKISELYSQKRQSAQKYKEENDRFYAKLQEDRARKAEKIRAQRAAEDEQKKKEISARLLEEAKVPAFQDKIEDCQTLIDYFSALNGLLSVLRLLYGFELLIDLLAGNTQGEIICDLRCRSRLGRLLSTPIRRSINVRRSMMVL